MAGTEANADPLAFANAPLDEAVGRLVREIRRTRPQVIVTYDEDQRGYPHPDHLRVHEISVAAFDAAGDRSPLPRGRRALPAARSSTTRVWPWRQMIGVHAREVPRARARVALTTSASGWASRPRTTPDHDPHRPQRLRGRAHGRAAGPRHPGRPGLDVLVRAPAGGRRATTSVRRVHPRPRSLVEADRAEDDLFAGLRAGVGAR